MLRTIFLIIFLTSGVYAVYDKVAEEPVKIPISVSYNFTTKSYDVGNYYDEEMSDAVGYYYKNYENSYWNYLTIRMNTEISSREDHLMYMGSFGFLEGYITCSEIRTFYPNFYSAVFGTSSPGKQTLEFLQENYDWMMKMSNENYEKDDYWYTVKATLTQLNGVYEGYKEGCAKTDTESASGSSSETVNTWATLEKPTLMHFLLLNGWGDLYQITMKYQEIGNPVRLIPPSSLSNELLNDFPSSDSLFNSSANNFTLLSRLKAFERCSAIIKLLPDLSDVIFGHTTWDSFEGIGPRILKNYHFPMMRGEYPEHYYDTFFSSSPGLLSSVDDFFIINGYANLAVTETTNSIYNLTVLDLVKPESVLSWTRAIVSNQLASNGYDWATQFSKYHSGTYVNQWMVLDLKRFSVGKAPEKGFFTVFEETPGLVHYEDMTDTLITDSYWASYNIPYFQDIIEASGNGILCSKDSDYCYETAPRALLFQQYHSQVNDIEGGKWILGYNSYQNDSLSKNDPCNTITCRGDLYEEKFLWRGAYGGLDVKVSSFVNAKRKSGINPIIHTRLGPSNDQQKTFCWSDIENNVTQKRSLYSHNGQPDCFDFPYVTFPPNQ
jgi:hypothetical protein